MSSRLIDRLFADVQESFGGQIRGISLSSFLQMMELESHTCTLEITSDEKTGTLFIRDGEVIAARCGATTGTEAALMILCWKNSTIQIAPAASTTPAEIEEPLMNLLLESRRRQDERQMPPVKSSKAMRRSERVDCLVSIEWDLDDWSYRSVVRDISFGGAFIETDQPVQLGEEVTLSFTVGDPPQTCRISATVRRRDERGIGVGFEQLDPQQQQVVEGIMKGPAYSHRPSAAPSISRLYLKK
jgi:Tfp pilus assembly protein PilZ